jgi:hypothetical protein
MLDDNFLTVEIGGYWCEVYRPGPDRDVRIVIHLKDPSGVKGNATLTAEVEIKAAAWNHMIRFTRPELADKWVF